ncbi:MAG: hypothetical protein OJF50_002586 [Nitrospira sp.]|nr:hypothetical protein [Nitrospira sp.]
MSFGSEDGSGTRTFSLDQAADAHRALNEHDLGKLALKPN